MADSRYTFRMPAGMREVLEKISFFTGKPINSILFHCIKAELPRWIERAETSSIIKGDGYDWKNNTIKKLNDALSECGFHFK